MGDRLVSSLITKIFIGLVVPMFLAQPVLAQSAGRYAIFLNDAPAAERFTSRAELADSAAGIYRRQIEALQGAVRANLASRNIQVTGSVTTLLNALFVVTDASRLAEINSIPGVIGVVALHRHRALLNRATAIVNAQAAWNSVGGVSAAGTGLKIAILDTGVDQNHPSLRDDALTPPPGFPKCIGSDCAFTNGKVIVARSYIKELGTGSDPNNPAADSRPDDFSPRDHVGHGTAVATALAGSPSTGLVTITGMAPNAYVGNYRIIGSPEINDVTYDDIMILALEDAFNDGMDIVSMSVGGPAFSGPLDSGATCGNAIGVPCDIAAQAFENAAKVGLPIVIAAGNSGADGRTYPTLNSIGSPADAPSVIAVGATTNSHYFTPAVSIAGGPSNLIGIAAEGSDSNAPLGAVSAPLLDIEQLGDNSYACAPLPSNSLNGKFALIRRGPDICDFSVKMTNAVNAGAMGAIFYAEPFGNVSPNGLTLFREPAVIIANTDGLNLKDFVDSHPDAQTIIDPNGIEQTAGIESNQLASFSSFGPTIGTYAMKPDVLAPGESIYMGTQSYDPLGEMFSYNGFVAADGTSFATPLSAGAAVLIKQSHPSYSVSQIKSALINTATQTVLRDDRGASVNILQTGPGQLAADLAIQTNVTVSPASLSFGGMNSGPMSTTVPVVLTNTGLGGVNLALSGTAPGSSVKLALDKDSVSIPPGSSASVNVTLSGTLPSAGLYSGAIQITGGSVPLRLPYMFLVGSSTPANLTVLSGDQNVGTVDQVIPDGVMAFKVTDANGEPISGLPVTFTPLNGVTLSAVSFATDSNGIAQATATLGPTPGVFEVDASAAGFTYQFQGEALLAPVITTAGVVDAAGYSTAIAPGSYITIFGSNLSLTTDQETTVRLPLVIDFATVSFDVPSAGFSAPGRMIYVSPGQVVLQIPWELQGQSSVQVKSSVNFSYGNVVTIPLSTYAPAFFEMGGIVAATDVSGKAISSSNPAIRGQSISLYLNGLGPVTNPPASGEPALANPLSWTTTQPTFTIGGQTAPLSFSGLTPGLSALYQVNVTLPEDLLSGSQPVTISIGGVLSKPSFIPVD